MKKVFLALLVSTALFSCSEPKATEVEATVVVDTTATACDSSATVTACDSATTTATVTPTVEVKK